jgi:hypothetical protein
VLAWVLQEPRWTVVDQILETRDVRPVLPAPAVTEVIYKARARGNITQPGDFIAMLTGVGIEPGRRCRWRTASSSRSPSGCAARPSAGTGTGTGWRTRG